jgi:WXG100 family type VII secretion target
MPDIAYNFGGIEQMAAELRTFVGQIDSQLASTVEAEYNKLLDANWTGEAATAFTQAKAKWNDLTADYQAGLTAFQAKVSASGENMQMRDGELARMFDV